MTLFIKFIHEIAVKILIGVITSYLGILCICTSVSAEVGAWIIFDVNSGHVLDEKNSNQKWYPASLTKIMTTYITYTAMREGEFTKDSLISISQRALQEPSSKLGLRVGTKITIETAIQLLLVKSANDVAVALAEYIAGSNEEFVAQMNNVADQLGMNHTKFVNANGWTHIDQVTTVRDLAILSLAIWEEFPEHRENYSNSGIQLSSQVYWSANKEYLTRIKGAGGLKTGYICDSGFNVVAVAQEGDKTLIAVVLGASSDLERTIFANNAMKLGFQKLTNLSPSSITLENLAIDSKISDPPAKGYCNRNKPNYPWLFEKFGPESLIIDDFDELSKLFSQPKNSNELQSSVKLPKIAESNKINWSEVFDLTVGQKINEEKIVKLNFEISGENNSLSPLPKAKPLRN